MSEKRTVTPKKELSEMVKWHRPRIVTLDAGATEGGTHDTVNETAYPVDGQGQPYSQLQAPTTPS